MVLQYSSPSARYYLYSYLCSVFVRFIFDTDSSISCRWSCCWFCCGQNCSYAENLLLLCCCKWIQALRHKALPVSVNALGRKTRRSILVLDKRVLWLDDAPNSGLAEILMLNRRCDMLVHVSAESAPRLWEGRRHTSHDASFVSSFIRAISCDGYCCVTC